LANIFFGGAAFPACTGAARSSLGGRTWFPNNVEFTSSLGVDVADPAVSKFFVLEVPSVVRAVSKFLGLVIGGHSCSPTKPVSALNIFFGWVAFPACASDDERSSYGGRTWVPNKVDFSSSLGVDVVDPWVSKFVVLEVASVVRAVSKFLGLVICACVLFFT
jgi:hypothetical protein